MNKQFILEQKRLGKIALLVLILSLLGCDSQNSSVEESTKIEQAKPAKIIQVKNGRAGLIRTYPGVLEAEKRSELAFRVSGELKSLPIIAGQRVKSGELLAALDDTDYKNTLDDRQSRYQLAQSQYDRTKKLLDQNLTSASQLDQVEAELKSAKAAFEQAQDNLKYTRLSAPFDGMVARADVENYQSIQAQKTIIEIMDDSSLEIQFSVPESLISQLKRIDDPEKMPSICGQVVFSAHREQSYRACHKEHEAVPDPITRNYLVVFSLQESTEFVSLPGMTVSITVDMTEMSAETAHDQFLIPIEAVFERDQKSWVWRVDQENRAQMQAVVTGKLKQGRIEILSGLNTEDRVIAAGVSYVQPGMLVEVMNKERGL